MRDGEGVARRDGWGGGGREEEDEDGEEDRKGLRFYLSGISEISRNGCDAMTHVGRWERC